MEHTHSNLMRRKTGLKKTEPEFGALSLSQALRQSVLKAAQYMLPVTAEVVEQPEQRLSLEPLAIQITDFSLVFRLIAGAEVKGLIIADRQVLAGLIGAMTSGRVERDELPDRMPTATEAHLAERFFAFVLEAVGQHMSERMRLSVQGGLALGKHVGDLKQIPHLMTDLPYRVAQVGVELGQIRKGTITLAVPDRAGDVDQTGSEKPTTTARNAVIEAALMGSDVPIEAVLHRYHLPLARVAEFKPGDSLPLPSTALSDLTLLGSGGEVIATARLGQARGYRAIKLRPETVSNADEHYADVDLDAASAPAVAQVAQSD